MSKYGVFSGPCFPVFGLNTEVYGVNLRIQSEYRKIRTRKNSVFGHFSRSVTLEQQYLFQRVFHKLSNDIQVDRVYCPCGSVVTDI